MEGNTVHLLSREVNTQGKWSLSHQPSALIGRLLNLQQRGKRIEDVHLVECQTVENSLNHGTKEREEKKCL